MGNTKSYDIVFKGIREYGTDYIISNQSNKIIRFPKSKFQKFYPQLEENNIYTFKLSHYDGRIYDLIDIFPATIYETFELIYDIVDIKKEFGVQLYQLVFRKPKTKKRIVIDELQLDTVKILSNYVITYSKHEIGTLYKVIEVDRND